MTQILSSLYLSAQADLGFFGRLAAGIKTFFIKMYEATFVDGYYKLYLEGIKNTLIMAVIAAIIGVFIGVIIATIKYIHQTSGKLKILNALANLYTTVIRGTPVMVQIMIIYFMIFVNVPMDKKILVAALSFGINSGAYAAEIIRGGIMAVDKGQSETGRSLGLSQGQTMRLIILPQAIRSILPSLFNEVIALVKETSVAMFIGVRDITNAGDLVRSTTWSFHPLIVSALIYLVIVIILTQIQKQIERRMALSDRS